MKNLPQNSQSLPEIPPLHREEGTFTASEERYRSLFEKMTEGYAYCRMIYEGDLAVDYIFEEVNNAFEPLTGLKNVTGRKVSEIVPGIHETNPDQLARYARVAGTGQPESYEAYIPQLNIWFSISAYSQETGFFVAIFGNITARKLAEEALRESQRFAESIAQNSTSTIYIYDLETRKNLYTNRNAAEFLGYSSEQIIEMGENILPAIIHPDDMPRVNRHFEEFADLRDACILEIEYRIRHASGDWHWNWGRHTIFKRRPNGAAWQMMGTAQDITRRKLAEDALRERAQLAELEAYTRKVWTHAGTLAATLQLCCEAIVQHLDAAFARIWTLNDPAQMLEMQASAGLYTHLDGPHGRVPVGQFNIGLIAQERKPHLTNQVVGDPRVGDQEWALREGMVSFAGYPLIVGDQLVGVIAIFARRRLSEITLAALGSVADNIALSMERQLREAELRESHEKFHLLADNITDVFWIASADMCQLHYVSPAFERIWGRPVETLYANLQLWIEFIVPEDRKLVTAAFASLTHQTPSFEIEYRIQRPDSEIRWVRALGFQVLNEAGCLIRLTGIISDITKRKLAEDELHLKTIFLDAQIDSTLDGMLVVNEQSQKILQNHRIVELFEIPASIADAVDDEAQVRWVATMVRNPDLFLEKIMYLYAHPEEISRDEIELKNGTVLDRYSAPVLGKDGKYYGRIWTFHDITASKRAEETQRQSKRFLRSTLDALSSHIAILDEHGKIIEVNAAWNRFGSENGILSYESVGDDYLDVCVTAKGKFSKEASAVALGIRSVMAGECIEFHLEYPCHSPSEERWFIVRVTRFAGAGPVRIVVAHENITARKRVEETLRLLSSAVEQSSESILITDTQLNLPGPRIVFVNPAFTKMTGYTPEEVLGKTPRMLQGPKSDREVLNRLRKNLESGETFAGDTINYRKDGTEFYIEWQVTPIRTKEGAITHFVAVERDVTERKLAERRLRRSEERYRSLIDNAIDAIFTVSAEGVFTSLNPAVETISGISRNDWLGRPFAPMVHPEDLPLAREMFLHILKGEPAPIHQLRGHPSLPRPARMEMTLAAQRDEMGKIIGILGIGRDITERKQLEEQLVQSQKMETVGRLAGGIAHEFNSILTTIIGQSEILLGHLPQGSHQAQAVTEISQAAGRAASLTRQLLAYGRKQFLQPETLELHHIVQSMESVLQHLMGGHVEMRIMATPGPHTVKVDAGQIEQVIMNLAINARDAMPGGGQLTLAVSNSTALETGGENLSGSHVLLTITDTGTGISEETKSRIFEPFFTTKGIGEGTGLGLPTCQGIIQQSGGQLRVESEPGQGATFKIYLPQVEPPGKKPETAPLRPSLTAGLPSGTETILLVEEDTAMREMFTTLLRKLGYQVQSAANALDALNLQQQPGAAPVDLLFTEVALPHLSGRELALRMRTTFPSIRILFTSSYTRDKVLDAELSDRKMAFLQKPFTPSLLAGKLRTLFDA